jgi:pyruvate dehydrogenase (quinone)
MSTPWNPHLQRADAYACLEDVRFTRQEMKGDHNATRHDLEDALRCAFQHDGPDPVDVVSARQEQILPPKITPVEAKNFGLFFIKAVLDGRGSQLIDLAETNVLR